MAKGTDKHMYFVDLIRQGVLEHRNGKIWRMKSTKPGFKPGRADSPAGGGYRCVGHSVGGKAISAAAHRVIWSLLNGPIPDGMEINHKNGNPGDNRPSNLEVVTHAQNATHGWKLRKEKDRKRPVTADPHGEAIMREYSNILEKERLAANCDLVVTVGRSQNCDLAVTA